MAKLLVNPTSSSRREVPLSRTLVSIGRDPSNDVVLPDAMVSRRHAVIEYRGNQYFLRDCNSSNGSLVNGDKVSERGLRDGDLVAIGTARLLFREELEIESGAKVVPHPSAPRQQCRGCGADHRQGDHFCRQCGAALITSLPPKAVCVSCGTVVPLPAHFCTACGTALPEAPDAGAEASEAGPAATEDSDGGEPLEPESTALSADALPAPPIDIVPLDEEPAGPPLWSSPVAHAGATSVAPRLERPVARTEATLPEPLPTRREPVVVARTGPRPTPLSPLPPPVPTVPAGFAPRVAAALIDTLVVAFGQLVVLSPAIGYWSLRDPTSTPAFLTVLVSLALVPVAVALAALYYIYFWGLVGTTPGKRLLGLAVVGDDGSQPIGTLRAAMRLFGYVLSAALLGVGFVLALSDGRALHDRLAGTRVVRRARA